mmetsp:Transcript_16461/g.35570  ORF Transcript_16461/g.35570 Transcript_16461/m.35570 type:complete len:250 (+) Transcript_16461:370-1119(+)
MALLLSTFSIFDIASISASLFLFFAASLAITFLISISSSESSSLHHLLLFKVVLLFLHAFFVLPFDCSIPLVLFRSAKRRDRSARSSSLSDSSKSILDVLFCLSVAFACCFFLLPKQVVIWGELGIAKSSSALALTPSRDFLVANLLLADVFAENEHDEAALPTGGGDGEDDGRRSRLEEEEEEDDATNEDRRRRDDASRFSRLSRSSSSRRCRASSRIRRRIDSRSSNSSNMMDMMLHFILHAEPVSD